MSRVFPIVVLIVSTLLGGGGGYLVNAGIRQLVVLPDGAKPAAPVGPAVAGVGDKSGTRPAMPASVVPTDESYRQGLLCRNLFDLSKVGDCPSKKGQEDGAGESTENFTDLKVTLLGTLVANPAQFSSALILTEGDDRARGYSISDKIADAEIIAIEAKLVRLLRDGNEEILRMDEEGEAPAKAPGTAAADKGKGDDEVTDLGDNKFAISSDTLDKYLNDLEGISRMGRALLHRGPDGEFDGYRLSAIRRNTIADKLGIRNGDIIHSVNGTPLNSMSAAMEAFNTMQNEKNFSFEVTRRGQKVDMSYEVR